MKHNGNLAHSEHTVDASTLQSGTFVQHGEDWTIGFGTTSFPLRNVLGLSYIQRLLEHPGEQFHALDLLTGTTSAEALESGSSGVARFREEQNLVVGRPGDIGPILDEQAKREYRRRISELNEELGELRERGNLNLLGERDYRRRAEVESEIEALTAQLAQAVGMFGRDRRSGSAAERARLNVTRAIRSAIQRISERNAPLGELLGSCIRTGAFCSYIPDARSLIEWEFTIEGGTPAPMAAAPSFASQPSAADFVQPLRSTTAFVGREKERELLRRCLQEVTSGQGRIVIIAGPPGIGKTRTAREAGDEARQQGFVALAGNCYDREDSVPFVPFVEALEVVLARAPGAAAIREILGDQAAELSRLLPQVRRLLPDLPMPMQASPEQSRRMLFNAVVELVGRQSALNPLLLLLEDLHWADEGTLSLLVHLARAISTLPVMIIATHRNDEIDMKPPLTKALDELMRLGVVEEIPLDGLAEPDVAKMIELLSGHEPSPALVDLIYSNTDGNPLFVQELIRDLDQNQSNGDFVERLQQGEVALPHSLRLVIGRRLALVTKETSRVLGTAAVVGRHFNFSLLDAATQSDPDRLVDSLEEAEQAGLISSRLEHPEARFRFAHEVIRRAVLDEISMARRQRLHLNIAQAMEQLHANSLEEHAEDLAHHFWSAGAAADPTKAIRYLQIAGEKAIQSSANVEAIGHLNKALQLLRGLPETTECLRQQLHLQTFLGTALIATKGFSSPEALQAYARARELSQLTGEAEQFFHVLFGQWLSNASRCEHRVALELGEQCLRLAQNTGDPGLVLEAHHALGVSLIIVGDLVSGLEHLERTVAMYDPKQHGDHAQIYGHDPAAVCLMHAGWALWLLGRPEQGLKRCNESLALAQQLSHPSTSATVEAFVACLQQWCGDVRAVEELSASAIAISTKRDFGYPRTMALMLAGWALVQRGQTAPGIEQMRLGLDKFRAMDALTLSSYFSGLLAEAYAAAGQVEEGLKILGQLDEEMAPWWNSELYRLKGELILRAAGQPITPAAQDEAVEYFRQALDIARAQKARSLELRAITSLSHLWLVQSKRSEARRALKEIVSEFKEGFHTRDLREAHELLRGL
jgi:tetratricopeptide (TPR) repeat protein